MKGIVELPVNLTVVTECSNPDCWAYTPGTTWKCDKHRKMHAEHLAVATNWFLTEQDSAMTGMPLSEALATMRGAFKTDETFKEAVDALIDGIRQGTTTPEQSYNVVQAFNGDEVARAWSRIMQSFGW